MKVATGITMLSLLLGVAAMAAGAGEAGAGIMAAGQQAALGKFLAFTRVQENSADQAGASFLSKAGISGRGSLGFFKKLQNQEFRLAIPQEDSYARTHPLNGERMAALENLYTHDPAWEKKTDAALEDRFQRVKAKLGGYVDDPKQTLIKYPETDTSLPARYARAYGWHKAAYPDKANAEIDSLLRERPHDPFFLELKGQVLLESGKPKEALQSLREAVSIVPDQPLISALLGHALIATEDEDNFKEAKAVLALGDRPRQQQSVRLVPARHRLRPRGRSCPRRAGDRRTLQSRRPAQARARQRRECPGRHSQRHARLDPRAGYRDGVADRGRKGQEEPVTDQSGGEPRGPMAALREHKVAVIAGLVGLAIGGAAVTLVSREPRVFEGADRGDRPRLCARPSRNHSRGDGEAAAARPRQGGRRQPRGL